MPEPAAIRTVRNGTEGVEIAAVGGRAVLRLKSWLPEYTPGGRPVMLAGQELPSHVGAVLSGQMHVLCVGPGEWLIIAPEEQGTSLRQHMEPDLVNFGLVLVDLSVALAALTVQGPVARELLSKGCGLDLHPRSFPAGRCARTRFAQVPAIIECFDASSRFELYVARSYFEHFHSWLADAAAEFE
jgi:sarcosine oxidase subunit gamma